MSSQQAFSEAVTTITNRIAGKNIDGELQAFLNENFPPGGEAFDELAELCRQGIDEGWLCANERGGVRYGRVIDQGPETNGFSVDVVRKRRVRNSMVRARDGWFTNPNQHTTRLQLTAKSSCCICSPKGRSTSL
jgi:hypothetical protein